MISTDLSGKVFGSLTVKELAGKDIHNNTVWLCACVCGLTAKIRRGDLTRGKSRSCGCSKRKRGKV